MGTQIPKKVPMGTRVPKWGPIWEQCTTTVRVTITEQGSPDFRVELVNLALLLPRGVRDLLAALVQHLI